MPIIFPEDETFDVGMDTRTPVSLIEYHYDCPFKFTGKINRLTFTLGPQQYTAAEKAALPAIETGSPRRKIRHILDLAGGGVSACRLNRLK